MSKNLRTPRTLSDCEFVSGYPEAVYMHKPGMAWRVFRALFVWGFMAALGVGLFFNLSK
jgi:hypothetical protein